mmetsp:Transcript_7065/g.11219  ORF Transcript_7065/g.11219 Transcript_7065/m.11219 type:complete len:174 (+) Transcript_7065:200-721(+)
MATQVKSGSQYVSLKTQKKIRGLWDSCGTYKRSLVYFSLLFLGLVSLYWGVTLMEHVSLVGTYMGGTSAGGMTDNRESVSLQVVTNAKSLVEMADTKTIPVIKIKKIEEELVENIDVQKPILEKNIEAQVAEKLDIQKPLVEKIEARQPVPIEHYTEKELIELLDDIFEYHKN